MQRSKINKGKAKGNKRTQEVPHQILWDKVKNGAPKVKGNKEFWKHLGN